MEFRLTDQQRQMVASVRDLAQTRFRQRALRWMDGTFPWENIRDLAKLGVLGMTVLEELAKVCYPTAMAVLGEAGVQTRVIAAYAPEGIRSRILPAVCTGDCILSICMTEPHAGTD